MHDRIDIGDTVQVRYGVARFAGDVGEVARKRDWGLFTVRFTEGPHVGTAEAFLRDELDLIAKRVRHARVSDWTAPPLAPLSGRDFPRQR